VCGMFVQLVASKDRLWTWIELYSLVDHFTIVPTFVGIYYNTNWIGQLFLQSYTRLTAIRQFCQFCQFIFILIHFRR